MNISLFENVLDNFPFIKGASNWFPVDESLNAFEDTLENVYPLVKDTSDDFYVDKFLNI